jgi:hypothetical protein
MDGTVTFTHPMTLVAGWVKKDLFFYIGGPTSNGPLSKYKFHMQMLNRQGETVYEDPLGDPDYKGQIIAGAKDVDPLGGTIVVTGLYQGRLNLQDGKINPFISGRCNYKKMHGNQLAFKVDPVVIVIGTTRVLTTQGTATSDPNTSLTQTLNYAPEGLGGSTAVTVTKTGDQRSTSQQTGETRNVTSVQALEVTQVGAPDPRANTP